MIDEETLTAYHEAGHAVIGYSLGGEIESAGLYAEADDWLPERYGDCLVNWGRVDANWDWQIEREVLTILAGPIAEMVYRGESLHPATYPPWQHDWHWALRRSEMLTPDPTKQLVLLGRFMRFLDSRIREQDCWAAIAAVADELSAHQWLDADQLEETLSFWIGR